MQKTEQIWMQKNVNAKIKRMWMLKQNKCECKNKINGNEKTKQILIKNKHIYECKK